MRAARHIPSSTQIANSIVVDIDNSDLNDDNLNDVVNQVLGLLENSFDGNQDQTVEVLSNLLAQGTLKGRRHSLCTCDRRAVSVLCPVAHASPLLVPLTHVSFQYSYSLYGGGYPIAGSRVPPRHPL